MSGKIRWIKITEEVMMNIQDIMNKIRALFVGESDNERMIRAKVEASYEKRTEKVKRKTQLRP